MGKINWAKMCVATWNVAFWVIVVVWMVKIIYNN